MPVENPALVEARLRALARNATGDELTHVESTVGAGLAAPDDEGVTAYFYVDDDPRAVGSAVLWAASRKADRVEILAASGATHLARRAGHLSGGSEGPSIGVWAVDGAEASPVSSEPVAAPPELPADHWALAGLISEAGARPIDDHGLLIAEIAGLEIGRVVDGPDGPSIDLGVGQADRELNQLVHRDADPIEGLRRVINAVVVHRRAGDHHPLARLARERWLRSIVLDDPSSIGAATLDPLVPLRPRASLIPNEPSAAAGRSLDDQPIVVVAMAGIDLDLIPEAADYRDRWDGSAEIVLIMPERDLVLSTKLMTRVPRARAIAVDPPWAAPAVDPGR